MDQQDTFPATGHTYEARFGDMAFHLMFHEDGKTMQFAAADRDVGTGEAVSYRALCIRPGVFMVVWTEANSTTVTHIEDFERGEVHTNITQPDNTFFNLSGRWTQLA